MFHLFRKRKDPEDVDAASRRHEAAHSALIDALRRLLDERNGCHGRARRQEA